MAPSKSFIFSFPIISLFIHTFSWSELSKLYLFLYCHLEFVCEAVADVAFLVDSSGSIGRRNWDKMKQFLKDMVKAFNVGPDKTHIAIVAYSTRAVLEFKFDRLKGSQVTEAGYNSLIDGIRFQRGFTYIDKALMLADEQVFLISAGMRPELPQVRKQRESIKICRPLCYSYFWALPRYCTTMGGGRRAQRRKEEGGGQICSSES